MKTGNKKLKGENKFMEKAKGAKIFWRAEEQSPERPVVTLQIDKEAVFDMIESGKIRSEKIDGNDSSYLLYDTDMFNYLIGELISVFTKEWEDIFDNLEK